LFLPSFWEGFSAAGYALSERCTSLQDILQTGKNPRPGKPKRTDIKALRTSNLQVFWNYH